MLNRELKVQECDATMFNSIADAWYINNFFVLKKIIAMQIVQHF